MRPKLSIVIVSHNAQQDLRECLDSVLKNKVNPEVIVVETGKEENFKTDFPNVTWIKSKVNKGFGHANNLGAAEARGKYFLFLNPDTVVLGSALKKIVDSFDKNKKAGIIGANLLSPNRKPQKWAFGKRPSIGRLISQKLGFLVASKRIDWVSGAALAIRKKLFRRLSGFDEKFFMYFEDIDLCLRAKKLSARVEFLRDAKIIHKGGKSIKHSPKRKRIYFSSQDYFFEKHKGKFYAFLNKIIRFPVKIVRTNPKSIVQWILGLTVVNLFSFWIARDVFVGAIFLALFLFGFLFWIKPPLGYGFILLTLLLGQTLRVPMIEESGLAILPLDALLALLVLVWFFKKLIKKEHLKPFFISIPILIFCLFLFFSYLYASRNYVVSEKLIAFGYLIRFMAYIFVFWIGIDIISTKKTWRRLLWLFVGAGTGIIVLGFLQLYFYPDFREMVKYGWDPHVGRLLSTWYDPNFVGGFFVVFLSLILGILVFQKKQKGLVQKKESLKVLFKKWGLWVLFGAGLVALVLTYSRSSYLAFLIAFLVIATMRSPRLLILGLLGAITLVLIFPYTKTRIEGAKDLDETARARINSWKNAFFVFEEKPFLGIGYNFFPFIKLEKEEIGDILARSRAGSDSSFLTVLVTTGILGGAAFLVMWFFMFWKVFQVFREEGTALVLRGTALGIFAGFIGLWIHSQFVNSLLYPYLLVVIWFLFALIISGKKIFRSLTP